VLSFFLTPSVKVDEPVSSDTVIELPSATVPPSARPLPALTVTELLTSPLFGMLVICAPLPENEPLTDVALIGPNTSRLPVIFTVSVDAFPNVVSPSTFKLLRTVMLSRLIVVA
jgi:hypothetical protein